MTAGDPPRYWWCLDHEAVETDEGCANSVRLGPFDDYAKAADALETARRAHRGLGQRLEMERRRLGVAAADPA